MILTVSVDEDIDNIRTFLSKIPLSISYQMKGTRLLASAFDQILDL